MGRPIAEAVNRLRLTNDLGFRPTFTLEAGVADYIARAYDEHRLEQG